MRLTLCLPGSLLPRQALHDTISGLELPALSLLMGRGTLRRGPAGAHYGWLARQWRLDAVPAAVLRLLGEGGTPGEASWLCLDPVHFNVHRRGVRLEDPHALALAADEDAQLREAIAPIFAYLGQLHGGAPGHWHLRLESACALATLPLPDAIARDVDPGLPGGADGADWRRRLAEAQTLLHSHPVNRARDAAGKPLVSSLWPWGEGRLPSSPFANWALVWTTDAVVLGLARASGITSDEPPPRFSPAAGNVLAVFDDVAPAARSFDAFAWRSALERLELDWFAPLVDALRRGRCTALQLIAFGPDATLEVDVARSDLLKVWRRPLPPARLAA